MADNGIKISPLTPYLGGEISGVDLTSPLNDAQVATLRKALLDHGVIFFRDQPLDFEQLKQLGRYFGELHIHSGVAGIPEHPEIVRIHADADSKFVAGEDWHSDLTCDPIPPPFPGGFHVQHPCGSRECPGDRRPERH